MTILLIIWLVLQIVIERISSTQTMFGGDVQQLQVDVIEHADHHVQIKVYSITTI